MTALRVAQKVLLERCAHEGAAPKSEDESHDLEVLQRAGLIAPDSQGVYHLTTTGTRYVHALARATPRDKAH